MSYQVLARKWRPKTFEELVGQEHVVQALVNGLDQDRVHHAFLFTGTRGVGKTTIARIFAKCLNCEKGVTSKPCGECSSCTDIDEGRFVDMLEIDAASRTGVDDMRELLESVQYSPNRGRFKVYIIDEVHMLSKSSFNALLKTMEEPPPHVKFLLATTDPEKIPVTILSRCLQFNLRRLLPDQIEQQLSMIVGVEEVQAEKDALIRLSRAADGSMRDGLSLLDQAIAFGGGSLTAEHIGQMLGIVDHGYIANLLNALINNQPGELMAMVEEFVAQSRDLQSVLLNLAETLHRICLVQCVPGYQDAERSDWDSIVQLAEGISPEDAQLFYQIAIKGRQELTLAPDPRTGLEMALLRMLAFRPGGSEQGSPRATAKTTSEEGSANRQVAAGGEKPRSGVRAANHGDTTAHSAPARAPDRSSVPPTVSETPESNDTEAVESDLFAQEGEHQPSETATAHRVTRMAAEADWVRLCKKLKLTGQARELARNLHLKSCQNDQWRFVISHSLRHLSSAACVDRLRQAICDQIGSSIMIQVLDADDHDLNTVANLQEQQLRTKMTDAELAIDKDPTVKALKESMGAKLVEDSIQPLQ